MANNELSQLFEEWGLTKYVDLFTENDLGVDVLPQLTETHLQELGVSMGDRLRMLEFFRGIAERTTAAASQSSTSTRGERRQLTVMFCDLVGSTSISEGMDPESYREVIVAYRRNASEVIREHSGFIARHLGDGLLVYFGYPKASEDDPVRAIRAGLAIIERIRELPDVKGNPLQARVGIATGVVVVGEIIGEGFAREREVSGETPNLAARLQGLAEPNTVIVSPTTRSLAGALFEYHALGPQTIKGLSRPVPVWQVLSDSGIENRFEARRLSGELSHLVGRDDEMQALRGLWQSACNGTSQMVVLQGEAGVGKSRLIEGLRNELEASGAADPMSCYGTSHYEHSAFHPFLREVERAANLGRMESRDERLERLTNVLSLRGIPRPHDAASLIASTLGFRSDDDDVRIISPREHRLRVMATLGEQLLGRTNRAPTLVIFEDVQWFDASSLELLTRYLEHLSELAVLVVVTCRSGFTIPWEDRFNSTRIEIARLSTDHCMAMVQQLCQHKGLPDTTIQEIVAKTDGIPLFIEEVTQTVIDWKQPNTDGAAAAQSTSTWVPMSLHDSLMARLDGLSEAKEVAQIGAALGRNFSHELIERTAFYDASRLGNALETLVSEGILRVRGQAPNQEYIFKHALVQEAAYGSLLHARRRTIHARIGNVLEQNFPELLQRHPEVCAFHHARAGATNRAIELWSEAGKLAFDRSANLESVSHFRAALSQLSALENQSDSERQSRECDLRLRIGAALVGPRGYAAPEVRSAYSRAAELSRSTGDSHMQFAAVRGLWHNHVLRGELGRAKVLSNQLLRSAKATRTREHALVALRASGLTALVVGEIQQARGKFEQGIKLYRPSELPTLMQRYGEDPGLYCLLYTGWANDWAGRRGQALQRTHQAVTLAERSKNNFAMSFVLALTAQFYQFRREPDEVLKYSERAVEVADAFGMVQWAATANVARGWALAATGKTHEGLELLKGAITHWRKIGAELIVPYFLCVQAQAYLFDGNYLAAREILVEADTIVKSTGQNAYASEIAYLFAELSAYEDPRSDQALKHWQAAEHIATRQGANLFILRALVGRLEFERTLGASVTQANADTRRRLRETLAMFDSDSATPDTQRAEALLHEDVQTGR
ncbi:MAG: adenylate/guanylate cyclase domain-containing protein [Pseudomonadota bacterium]